MKIITGGVTRAKGFEAAGVEANIKYQGRTDMAVIYSEKPCVAAGTFTTNVAKAAPVVWDQKIVKESDAAQAIIVNSGIANACTGAEGYGYCKDTADAAAKEFGIPTEYVLLGSTGVIGKQLPIDRIQAGVAMLAKAKSNTVEAGTEAAKAIMTTDTCEKELAVEIEIGGKTVIIFIYGTHDIELDQAGSLHLLIVDGTFGIFCKIAYIYGPGSVIGRKKRLYLVQKVVHAGIRIVCESASAGWRKSSFFLSGRRTVLAARSFGRIRGCRCICGFFLCGRTLDLS